MIIGYYCTCNYFTTIETTSSSRKSSVCPDFSMYNYRTFNDINKSDLDQSSRLNYVRDSSYLGKKKEIKKIKASIT